MLITAVCVELSILADGFFGQIYDGKGMHAITISMTSLIDGNFAAAALLISFGALIGKAGPLQLLVLAILETIAYNANKQLLLNGAIGIADIGGTVIIHNFGAYFGLGAAYVFGVPAKKDLDDATTSTVSDLLSMIGTVFLWLYWPSFVAGEAEPSQMLTARINTVRLSKPLCLRDGFEEQRRSRQQTAHRAAAAVAAFAGAVALELHRHHLRRFIPARALHPRS